MDFQKVINERRSMRSFDSSKKVTEETMRVLVRAAIQAPSWKNSQTARYHCVLSETMLNKVSQNCLPEFNQMSSKGAALVITSFVKNRSGFDRNTQQPANELGNGWGIYDLGLHNENFILKAKDLGLDTLIMGIRDEKALRSILDIPEEEIVVSVIAVGYGTREAVKPPRKCPEEIMKLY